MGVGVFGGRGGGIWCMPSRGQKEVNCEYRCWR